MTSIGLGGFTTGRHQGDCCIEGGHVVRVDPSFGDLGDGDVLVPSGAITVVGP
jgi:hypothetical protein